MRGGAPDALLIDFDGVIRHWLDEPIHEIELDHRLPRGSILKTAHRIPEYNRGVRGEVSYEDWYRATAEALISEHGANAAAAVDQWRRYRGHLDSEMVVALDRLRRVVPVVLVSNAHDCLRADLEAFGITKLFTAVVCSAEEGIAKPAPELFTRTCRRIGILPGRTVFLDDRPENVAAAKSVGIRAEVFRDVSQLFELTGDDLIVGSYR